MGHIPRHDHSILADEDPSDGPGRCFDEFPNESQCRLIRSSAELILEGQFLSVMCTVEDEVSHG